MPRPFRCRRIEQLPVYRSFSPDDITATESVRMTVDEFEALRLLDDEVRSRLHSVSVLLGMNQGWEKRTSMSLQA